MSTMRVKDPHSTLVHLIPSKLQLDKWEDFTHTLRTFGLNMPNLWSTYYIERCYLKVFSMLFEGIIPKANHHKSSPYQAHLSSSIL